VTDDLAAAGPEPESEPSPFATRAPLGILVPLTAAASMRLRSRRVHRLVVNGLQHAYHQVWRLPCSNNPSR